MSENVEKSHSVIKTVALIFVILIVGAFWYFILFGPYGNVFSNEFHRESDSYRAINQNLENITDFHLEIDADIAAFDVQYTDPSSNQLIKIDWEYSYSISEDNEEDPILITISNETEGNILTYRIDVDYKTNYNPVNIRNIEFQIDLNPNFQFYGFDVDLTVGSFELEATSKTINYLELSTTTGYISLDFADVELSSNVDISTTTGAIDLVMYEISLTYDLIFNVETTTGGGSIYWDQLKELGADLSLNIIGTTGGYDIDIICPLSLARFDIFWDNDVGGSDVSFEPDFQEIESNHFQSDNFDDETLDLISVFTETNVGGSEITIDATE